MTDVYSKIILDIANHIKETVPGIVMVDQYLGQDQTDLRPSLAYPAVLVDFDRAEYSMIGASNQIADSQISIRLFLDNYASSISQAPELIRQKALEVYDIEKRLVEALHNWQPSEGYIQPLVRISSYSQNRNDIGLRIRNIVFTTSWIEYSS